MKKGRYTPDREQQIGEQEPSKYIHTSIYGYDFETGCFYENVEIPSEEDLLHCLYLYFNIIIRLCNSNIKSTLIAAVVGK